MVAYFKDDWTKGKVSVFNYGKLISVGTKSEDDAFHDLKHVTRVLTKAGLIEDLFKSYRVRNMVAVVDIGRR